MKIHRTPVASAVALTLLSMMASAQAQSAAPAPASAASAPKLDDVQTVTVTGIRASLDQALNKKRNADSLVEVITAEDVGKMPDKNIADSLQRVPGVTISSASASEGGFDEKDRVSLRGTGPSLTQTMINGHMVSSGDWFVLDQVGTVGRSVSYALLPSELINTVVVHKASTADLVEGGVAGTVDILTNRPLDSFRNKLTLNAALGAVYADLPGKTDPQFSILGNWKNDANTLGVMAQGFYEKRSLRRDGQEMLGYTTISPTSPLVVGNSDSTKGPILSAHPDLANVAYPNDVGATLFEQTRERKGGLLDIQLKPMNNLTLDLSGFYSKLNATNYNRNWLLWNAHVINGGNAIQDPEPGYTVSNGTLTSATFAPIAGNQYAIVDNIYRPGSGSTTKFVDFDGQWKPNEMLTLSTKIGQSKGEGITPEQDVFEGDVLGTGSSFTLHGTGTPANGAVLAGNPANFNGTKLDWVFGASPASTEDKETYGQIDGEYAIDQGVFTTVKAGLRYAQHTRSSQWTAQGPGPNAFTNLPSWTGQTYPGNYASTLGGGGYLTNVWELSPQSLQDWARANSNRDPVTREYFPGEFALKEKDSAAYIMANMEGNHWHGNVGLRLVQTKEDVTTNVAIPQNGTDCAALGPCSVPGAITTSAFGAFYRKDILNTYNDPLPSANLTYSLTRDAQLKFDIAKTMARPDFSALGGAISLDDTNHTGSGGNPSLKPIRSTNYDAALEWYYAPKSLLQAGLFYMDLKNYVGYGVQPLTFLNIKTGLDEVYNVSAPINSSGHAGGLELAWEQPLAYGFGTLVNYTYTDAKETGGGALVGASRNTYNLTGYYENDVFSARLAYNFRSKFYNGLDRASAQFQDDTATLSGSLGYKITDHISVSFDAMNLNNPKLKYYAANTTQPTAFYVNGRQYYLMLRANL